MTGGRSFNRAYFFAQQSPGQQPAPELQQLESQQEAVQHFVPGLQQESALTASAERDESPRTRTASNLNFI